MGTRPEWGSISRPSTPCLYRGLEDNRALERAMRHAAPDRRAHHARPDLDAASAAVVERRYLEAVGDQRSAHALAMHARARQRAAHARQRAEVRGLEDALQTPFAQARARDAARAAADAHGAALAKPRFDDVAALEATIARALASARSARGQARTGAGSTHVKERERGLRALAAVDPSSLVHAPLHAAAPSNALVRARAHVARAQSAQAGRREPLLGRGGLHLLIAHLLEEKVRADAVDDLARSARQPLCEFVTDELGRRYGLRELAAAHELKLRQSCVALRDESARIRLFAAAMGWLGAPAWPSAQVSLYLCVLAQLFAPTQLRDKLGAAGEVRVHWRDFKTAIRKVFYAKAVEERLIAGLEPLTQAVPSEAEAQQPLWHAALSRAGSLCSSRRSSFSNWPAQTHSRPASPSAGRRGSLDGRLGSPLAGRRGSLDALALAAEPSPGERLGSAEGSDRGRRASTDDRPASPSAGRRGSLDARLASPLAGRRGSVAALALAGSASGAQQLAAETSPRAQRPPSARGARASMESAPASPLAGRRGSLLRGSLLRGLQLAAEPLARARRVSIEGPPSARSGRGSVESPPASPAAGRRGSVAGGLQQLVLDASARSRRASVDGRSAADSPPLSRRSSVHSAHGERPRARRGSVLMSGRQLSLDVGLGYVLDRFDPTWDTLVSHLHRPLYSEDQLFLTHRGGYYTALARQAQGKTDVVASEYTRHSPVNAARFVL